MRTKPTPDALTDDEVERIRDILREAEHSNVLSQWEEEFVDSVRERLAEHGLKMNVSDKMWEIISRIEEKLG